MKEGGALWLYAVGTALLLGACGGDEAPAAGAEETASEARPSPVRTLGDGRDTLSAEAISRGRLDPSWRRVVELDSAASADPVASPEAWEDISAPAVNGGPTFLPLSGGVAGPSVLRVQVLLERALFSPGVIDGRWGKNTEKAVYWLQKREGLPATGRVDSATFARLEELAGGTARLVEERALTPEDVEGPFVDMPADIYDAKDLECTCYESLPEKLAERFHVTPDLLGQLNPGRDLEALEAGDRLQVPLGRDSAASADGEVAEIVISVEGSYLHARDGQGRILYHFPTTLGSGYSPEEGTTYEINSVTPDPWWNLQPELLHVGDPTRPAVQIPPGPNNAVGNMWIDLSKEHYGIHGTARPETIGYATSSGCVRLTNWDANFLGDKVAPGIPVRFIDIPPSRRDHPSHGSG